jgi:hypothetical protein
MVMQQLRLARLASSPKARKRDAGDRIMFVAERMAQMPMSELDSKLQITFFDLARAAIAACDEWPEH